MGRNSFKHEEAKLTGGNYIDLNKDLNINLERASEIVDHSEHATHLHACSLKNFKSCSDFLSLAMPTAQPKKMCEVLGGGYSAAIALAGIQGLKMDSIHDKGAEINFVCKEHLENDPLNVEVRKLDHATDTMKYSGSAKVEGKTVNNMCQLFLPNKSNSFGSLCYEIPKLEDVVPSHSPVFSTHHIQQCCEDGFLPPVAYTTPCGDGEDISDQLSVESILKSAAENFPGTPSILRRRKREKTAHGEDSNVKSDSFHTPLGKCTTESPHSFKTATFLSLGPPDNKGLSAVGSFDVSPPYRLRSKRMAILKTVEKKHLDFSSDEMYTDTMEKYSSCKTECTNTYTDVSSKQEMKMTEHIVGMETLAKDFTYTAKLGLI
jgi:myb proto-oncogene protein